MALTWDEIVGIVNRRRRDDSAVKKRMIEVRDRFNGDYVVPLPDVKGEPVLPITLPNLVADGIETIALRASGVEPGIVAPALDQNKPEGVRSIQRAMDRRRAWKGSWWHSQMELLTRRALRQLSGYGSMAWVVVPDFEHGRGRIETRDALTSYPDSRDPDDIRMPTDVAFVYGRTARWVLNEWADRIPDGKALDMLRKGVRNDEVWEMVEWLDHDQTCIGLVGPRDSYERRAHPVHRDMEGPNQLLMKVPNRAGRCAAVVGQRITLDRIAGQMDAMLPTYDLANRIMALEVDAMERSIYPDRFVLASDNREPVLVERWKDGREGGINRITNASQVGVLNNSPNQMAPMIVDRLESSIRQSAGVNALASGLQPGSLRTGRALDSFQGFSIEPRIMELHQIDARAKTFVNELVADTEIGYFPNRKIVSFSGEATDQGILEYKPSEVWETNLNAVVYPLPGADINNMTLAAGQMVGAKIGSRRDAMALHPAVPDPDRSLAEMMTEDLDLAILQGLQQQLASGQLPMMVAAKVKKKVRAGVPLETAIEEADQEIREQQASMAEAGSPEVQPGMAADAPVSAQPVPEEPQTMGARPNQAGFRELINALQATAPRSAGGDVG